jgi:branched-subunit amino acid transport protein
VIATTNGFHHVRYMLIAIAGLTVITFATRASFFLAPERVRIPPVVERVLRYAPACALTAIVAPAVLTKNHQAFISVHNNQMWAVLAATVVFTFKRNMTLMVVVGMGVFTVLRLVA